LFIFLPYDDIINIIIIFIDEKIGLIAMSITDSLNSNIKNKVLNSSIGKLLKGKNWMETSSGNNFIPEYTKTDGQKKFSSSSAIPNLVKPETMFFVYFNIKTNQKSNICLLLIGYFLKKEIYKVI
jgi:hypothetical protein